MRALRYSNLTEYDPIFKNSYWGNFQLKSEVDIGEIVRNRNKFAKDFSLKAYHSNPRPTQNCPLFDHCELFKCLKGYVYIVSPYLEFDKTAEMLGLKKYLKLYADNATTYIREFSSKIEFNRFLKEADRIILNLEA